MGTWHCSQCGSTNVEVRYWLNPNWEESVSDWLRENLESFSSSGINWAWCHDGCDETEVYET